MDLRIVPVKLNIKMDRPKPKSLKVACINHPFWRLVHLMFVQRTQYCEVGCTPYWLSIMTWNEP